VDFDPLCAVEAGSNQAGSPCCTISPHNRALHISRVMLRATLLDDFGLKPLRPPADEDLHELIAERYEAASTIVTSNLDLTEWDQAFPANRLLASATLDRLRHNAYCLVLDGHSYQSPRHPPEHHLNLANAT
ncbi:ATP-binding protein, partial [Burkholderia vietnamiensis]